MTPLQFGLRIGVAALMVQVSAILFFSTLYEVTDKFHLMSGREQSFAGFGLALLGYAGVRWVEYQVWQFIVMFRGTRSVEAQNGK